MERNYNINLGFRAINQFIKEYFVLSVLSFVNFLAFNHFDELDMNFNNHVLLKIPTWAYANN